MSYTWSKDLETGNIIIDTQHKQLIQAVNNLIDACNKGKGRAEIQKTMQYLLDYTAKHFSEEEALQTKHRYPDYNNHKKLHEGFKAMIRDLSNQIDKEGATIAMVGKINSATNWLINHIKKEDTKIAAHIKKHG